MIKLFFSLKIISSHWKIYFSRNFSHKLPFYVLTFFYIIKCILLIIFIIIKFFFSLENSLFSHYQVIFLIKLFSSHNKNYFFHNFCHKIRFIYKILFSHFKILYLTMKSIFLINKLFFLYKIHFSLDKIIFLIKKFLLHTIILILLIINLFVKVIFSDYKIFFY